MILNHFVQITQNLHFAGNTQNDRPDRTFKIKTFIDHFNRKFSEVLSHDNRQSIDEHMVKFEGLCA